MVSASGPDIGGGVGVISWNQRSGSDRRGRSRGLEGNCHVIWPNTESQPGAVHPHCSGGRDLHLHPVCIGRPALSL